MYGVETISGKQRLSKCLSIWHDKNALSALANNDTAVVLFAVCQSGRNKMFSMTRSIRIIQQIIQMVDIVEVDNIQTSLRWVDSSDTKSIPLC